MSTVLGICLIVLFGVCVVSVIVSVAARILFGGVAIEEERRRRYKRRNP